MRFLLKRMAPTNCKSHPCVASGMATWALLAHPAIHDQAAMSAGATDNGKPGARLYYDPRYYAANVFDPDGYSLEAVYKSWQHRQS